MSAKIAAFFITLLVNVVIGVVVFFFMLLAMNGFHESDATYGFVTYIVLALLVSLTMSAGASFAVHVLLRREFRGWVSALIAIPIFSVIGGVLKIACSFIGVLVADYVRLNY